MPCHHFLIQVPSSKFKGLVSFLLSALAHTGFKEHRRPVPQVVGLGEENAYLWISSLVPDDADETTMLSLLKTNHIAFTAQSTQEIHRFYEAALAAGGIDNGEPGPRPHYGPKYYAAFVRDPAVGINFEMVCFV